MQESIITITKTMVPWIRENMYAVSNFGYIKNLNSNKLLRINDRGMCTLEGENSNCSLSVSRLVYSCFNNVKLTKSEIVVNIDGDPTNANINNLTVLTRSEYIQKIRIIQNVMSNTGLPDAVMSSKTYYQNPKKALCHFVDETWKDITAYHIPNIQPWYLISNYGRIYSKATDSIIKSSIINSGYIRAQLISITGDKIDVLIHRLVASVFIPNDDPINKTEVNHINENTFDNRVCNLEWVTPLYNLNYSAKADRTVYYNKTFSDDVVKQICEALTKNMSYCDICNKVLNCKYDSMLHRRIYKIHKRKIHINISKDYDF